MALPSMRPPLSRSRPAHKSREAGDANWKAFQADPDWKAAKAESEKGGVLVEKVDVVWLNPTEYSALK